MNVFITGATGFLGRYIVEECIKRKFHITTFVRKTNNLGKKDLIKKFESMGIKLFYGSIENFQNIKDTLHEDYDTIFHLASIPKESSNNFNVDVLGTRNLLRTIIDNKIRVKTLLFMSTTGVFGPQNLPFPINENTLCNPKSTYAISKYKAELLVKKFCKEHKMSYMIIRSPRIYGPGDWQKTFLNYIKLQYYGLSPILDDLPISLVYIKNLVHGIFLSLKYKNETFIIADKKTYSAHEIEETISSIVKPKYKITVKIPRSIIKLISKLTGKYVYGINNVRYSVEKAKDKLNYSELYSLKKGLQETIKWYESMLLL